MNNQYLIIYKFNVLFQILEELDLDLNFKIIQETDEFKIRNKNNNLFNHINIIDTKKAAIVGDIVAATGTLLVLYINFFSLSLSGIYLLNRFFIKMDYFCQCLQKVQV